MPPWSRLREDTTFNQALQAPLQSGKLAPAEQLLHFFVKRVAGVSQLRLESGQTFKHAGRDRFTGEIPDDATQLVVCMEANTMIDGPQAFARSYDDVSTFSIGIVYQDIEQGDTLRLLEETTLQRQVMLLRIVFNKVL